MPGKLSGKVDAKSFLKEYWWVFALILIVAATFWIRSFPARFGEITDLDSFYFYRIGEYALDNNLSIHFHDALRYYPTGVDPYHIEYVLPIYIPVVGFVILQMLGSTMTFLQFIIIAPALLGTAAVFLMYFLGKEIFRSRLAGIFTAFFFSVIPASITRMSAGVIEKEPIAALFIPLTAFFFVRAFRNKSLWDGILAGLSLAMVGMSWGGVQFIYILFSGFYGLLFIIGAVLVLLNYLFGNLGKWVESLEACYDERILLAFLPLMLIGIPLHWIFPHNVGMNTIAVQISFGVLGILLVRYGVKHFKLVSEEKLPFVIPGLMVLGVMAVIVGSMFIDSIASSVTGLISLITFNKGVLGETVAENAPGDWSSIQSTTSNEYVSGLIPFLSPVAVFFSATLFMILGFVVLIYMTWKDKDWSLLFPLFWFIMGVVGVFYYVRLVYILSFPAALLAGFFVYWMIDRASKTGVYKRAREAKKKLNLMAIVVVLIVSIIVITNMASAYVYALNLAPAICFPRYNSNNPFDVQPCITYDQNGKEVYADGQPWYEAFTFMREQTPKDAVILSWWDFGHWFHARGERASVADGGNMYGVAINGPIARWYVDDVSNWSKHEPWIVGEHGSTIILMDYTLPGKYGAISKIASEGEQIVGYLQMEQAGAQPSGNNTIYIFQNGPYEIWLPMSSDGSLAGTPMFLVSQNGQYYQKAYINDVCTAQGIVKVGNQTPAINGCVAISDIGIFYVPQEAENSIFNSLMFMEGQGLPVKKIFDNRYVKMYEIDQSVLDKYPLTAGKNQTISNLTAS